MSGQTQEYAANSVIGKMAGTEAALQIEFGSVIQNVDELIAPPPVEEFVSPGFIDLQVNGFAGVDFNDPASSHEAIARSVRTMFHTGVTRLFPTVITGSHERMAGSLRNLASCKDWLTANDMPEGNAIEAFHVEGPHISPDDGPRGAHPREQVRPPSVAEFDRLQDAANGLIRIVTVSPEWAETPDYVRHLVRSGVVASIGHTKATRDQIKAAVDAGATMSTHLGNGSFATLPKTDNYLWDQLVEDRLTAGFILDGIHLPTSFIQAAFRAKGLERSVLVTDAVMPAMCAPGPYRLGQLDVQLQENGSVVLRGGTRLAGSALRMDVAIANAVRLGGVTLRQALSMATVNAARVARLAGRLRGLSPGEKADLVLFRWDSAATGLTVTRTIVAGQTVYVH